MMQATIIGGAGYTGGELIRILLNHPECEITSIHSRSQAGKYVQEIHTDLIGETNLMFSDIYDLNVDVVFLCMGHGESKSFINNHHFFEDTKIIDLSQDFRYENNSETNFIYGLPEINRSEIRTAQYVANPGCFATAIQLALLPLASENFLKKDIHVSAITGSTGAGQSLSSTTHFTWRNSNISLYKPFTHQHMGEIAETLKQLQNTQIPAIQFLPFRGNFTRGILASVYTYVKEDIEIIETLYNDYYESHPFTGLSKHNPDVKQVVNTNKSLLYLEKHENILLIVSVIDNLIKGASGQAVQNMNLMFGLDETLGLRLKPSGY
jgi:N-acetyl-gamma-glutamyl-phosphate reductase